jgi:hypothetical protein
LLTQLRLSCVLFTSTTSLASTTAPLHVLSPGPEHDSDNDDAGPAPVALTTRPAHSRFGRPLAVRHEPPVCHLLVSRDPVPRHFTAHDVGVNGSWSTGQRTAASAPTSSP